MFINRSTRITGSLLILAACLHLAPTCEKSVRPGVNKKYKGKLNVDEWTERFESESREIFKHRDKIADTLRLRKGMDVADIGAGTGFFTRLFAARVGPEGRVYAVDIAADFLRHIDAQARERGVTNITTVLNKDRSAELPAESIDLAFICDVYHHFEYPRSMMRSIRRALRPGGEVVVIDFYRSEKNIEALKPKRQTWIREHVRIGRQEAIDEITSAGFQLVDDLPKTPYLKENYLIRFRKTD